MVIAKRSRRFDHRPMFHMKHFLMGVGVGSLGGFVSKKGEGFAEVVWVGVRETGVNCTWTMDLWKLLI